MAPGQADADGDDREAEVLGEQAEPEVGQHQRRDATSSSATASEADRPRSRPTGAAPARPVAHRPVRVMPALRVRSDEQALRPPLQERDDRDEHHHLGEADASVQYSTNALQHAEREGGDHRAPQLPEAADDDDQERVDDVVGAERRADRAEQGQRARRRRRPGRSR